MKAMIIVAILAVLGVGMMSFKSSYTKPKYQINEKTVNNTLNID